MSMNPWAILRPQLFQLDAERAHRITLRLLRLGSWIPGFLEAISGSGDLIRRIKGTSPTTVAGIDFFSRVGLAAGFDKNAELIDLLPRLGFGFAEIGTVTPRPQSGNPLPRLWRDPAKEAIFNRMGFNNEGAMRVSQRLRSKRRKIPSWFRVGVNIGKNKDTPNEDSATDYREAIRPFEGLADYVVVNVSSPNTPGLRDLQTQESLRPILSAVRDQIQTWEKPVPLFLKLAPEVTGEALDAILRSGPDWGVQGWVLTNTLAGEYGEPRQSGGWSGKPLWEISEQRLAEARRLTSLPIISVGGVMSAEDAAQRIRLGAQLIQIYSGWIFRGPRFPGEITLKNS